MADARNIQDHVPTWSGKLQDIYIFDEDIQIYSEATKKDDRPLLCSRIMQRMRHHSAQRRIALQLGADKRQAEDGAAKLVEHLRKSMGNKAPIAIAQTLDMYLYRPQ